MIRDFKSDFRIPKLDFYAGHHPVSSERYEAIVKARAKAIDDEIRRMLGLWVSEIEPEIWFDASGNPMGIGYKGGGRIIIQAAEKLTFEYVLTGYPEGV